MDEVAVQGRFLKNRPRVWWMVATAVALALVAGSVVATHVTTARGQAVVHVDFPIASASLELLDFGKDGLRLGDRLAAHGPLLDGKSLDRVGTAYRECVVQRHVTDDAGLWVCTFVLELGDGDIMLTGLDPRGPGVSTFAVTGGSGVYNGAGGEATFTDTKTDTDMVIVLTA